MTSTSVSPATVTSAVSNTAAAAVAHSAAVTSHAAAMSAAVSAAHPGVPASVYVRLGGLLSERGVHEGGGGEHGELDPGLALAVPGPGHGDQEAAGCSCYPEHVG